jgi:hypothetical protein
VDPKPFASLSSGLLARKGAARPAMRPQGFGQVSGNLEDLGWDDMGFEPPKAAASPRDDTHDGFGEDIVEHPRSAHPTGLTPIGSPVHTQQAEIEDRLKADDSEEEFDDTAEPYDPEVQPEEALPTVAPVAQAVPVASVAQAVPVAPVAQAVPVAPVALVTAVVPKSAPTYAPKSRAAPGSKGKAAFTLRLDKERHLKLRLACAVDGRSAQQIVTAALDQLLAQMPELGTLAAKAKRKG